jgi:hypothetical protein
VGSAFLSIGFVPRFISFIGIRGKSYHFYPEPLNKISALLSYWIMSGHEFILKPIMVAGRMDSTDWLDQPRLTLGVGEEVCMTESYGGGWNRC